MTLIAQGFDLITDQISPNKQGWTREVTVSWSGHKIRATVYRDSYDFQSRIKVEVWSPATFSWNSVRTIAGEDRKGLPSAYALSNAKINSSREEARRVIFDGTAELVNELIAYAQAILA